jgi:hypothetical protein
MLSQNYQLDPIEQSGTERTILARRESPFSVEDKGIIALWAPLHCAWDF